MMQRSYYSNDLQSFCTQSLKEILGQIAFHTPFDLDQNSRNSFVHEIKSLQHVLKDIPAGSIAFEYTIPRIGERIDVVIACAGILYVLEFKVGESSYPRHAIDQVVDYALALKYFHQESHQKKIVPLVICTHAPSKEHQLTVGQDGVYHPILCNDNTLGPTLTKLTSTLCDEAFHFEQWLTSSYMPTPTIIEAAQALYRGHDVKEISRSDAGAYNLSLTTKALNRIIEQSKQHHEKSICFVTGVPGAGKTLVGLNIANERHQYDEQEHAVFLSGNGPLVAVLREALARDEIKRFKGKITKTASKRKVAAFIQNIHHFRDAYLPPSEQIPAEKVAIFDEAQRAWTKEQTAKFMLKRHVPGWNMSEPEFLISVMDRHQDWTVIICLIGGGQEIHTGEAGLLAWFDALRDHFPDWNVYVSPQISDVEYTHGKQLEHLFTGLRLYREPNLHLSVSLRSFRNERVSAFVKSLLDENLPVAQQLYSELSPNYPITITRSLEKAQEWIRAQARGTERYGLIASSGAKRLRQFGIWVQSNIQ
ncbi:DNA/RNA helicase domain-containing protein, partial [Akkermansia sp.]|uniref:DNA/RNA helicase domain-containing protein n=2 Tax=Akkermansia sp. TaxID=1872421 RepID=UPI003AEF4629